MTYSILIAHYNNYNFFIDCYKSLLSQTDNNFEIIIVDDCSTDNSINQIKALTQNDNRVKISVNETNKGVGYTKKKCIELATGEICGFLDPDDALMPNGIEISKSFFNDSNTAATYSRLNICDGNLNIIKPFPNTHKIKNGEQLFFNLNFEVAHFFSFRKDVYLQTSGIDETLSSAVDQDLYLKLYEKGNFTFIDQPLYLYRIHEKGVSQEKSKKNKLNHNWHNVILTASKRRHITNFYGKNIDDITNLPQYILKKQKSYFLKFLRILS